MSETLYTAEKQASQPDHELDAIKTLLKTPLTTEEIAERQMALEAMYRLFDTQNAQASTNEVLHTDESLREAISATYGASASA